MEFMEMVYLALVLVFSISYALIASACILTYLGTSEKVSIWLTKRMTKTLTAMMNAMTAQYTEQLSEMDPAEFNQEIGL